MPRRITQSPEDKARSLSEFLRHRGDGKTVLTSKNEADNPAFDRFDTDGKLEGVVLDGPFEESGFKAYGKGPGSPTYESLQAVVPRTEPYWEQRAPFVTGDTLPDANKPSQLAPYALPPRLELISDANVGFAGGWRSITWAYGYEVDGVLFVTNCAPLFTLNIANGTGLRITPPGGVPENVPLIVFGITDAFATQNEAANATEVWVQKTVSTRPRVPSTVDMWGPEQRTKTIPFLDSQNETYLGSIYRPWITVLAGGSDEYEGHFSGYFKTRFGKSLSFGVHDYNVEHQIIQWKPSSWKAGAVTWVPQFVDEEGNWREHVALSKGAYAWQDTNIAEHLGQTFDSDLINEDTSGIDGPDSALDAITIGASVPATGDQSWRITKTGTDPETQEQDESPPSPVANISVVAGEVVRVSPPYGAGNWITNAEASQRGIDGVPQGWEWPTTTSIGFIQSVPGVQTFVDISSSSTSADIARTPSADVESQPTLSAMARISITNRTSGRVDWVAQQTNLDATTTEFVLASFSANGEYETKVRLGGIVNSQADQTGWARLGYNPNAKSVRFILRHFGSGGTGVRDLTSSLWNVGMFLGESMPRKRYSVDPITLVPASNEHNASLSTEAADKPYPTGGYVYTVLDPINSQRALLDAATSGVYVPGNMVEYFGPSGTPVVSTYFISGMRTPVRSGEQRTLSVYLFWQGVVNAGTPLRAVVKNSQGRVVQDLGGFAESVTGHSITEPDADENGFVRRSITFVVHPEGSSLEILSGGVGDGLYRVMGLQNELGATMTEFSDDYVGFGSLVSTFDLAVPGVPEGELESLSGISRLVRIGADVTHVFESGVQVTRHTVFARARHRDDAEFPEGGGWTTDIADLDYVDENYIVQVGTILSTTDIEETPVLDSHYLYFERVTDSGSAAIGTLCRSDGTEFDGTALVYNFPNVRRERPLITETFADNTGGFAEMGQSRYWVRGFGLQVFLNSTAEELMALVGEGLEVDDDGDEEAGTLIAEIYGERYRLRVLNINLLSEEREAYLDIAGTDEKRWLIQAEDLEGEVMAREPF